MRETRPLKQTANVLSGAFIKMSRTVDFRHVSERQGGDGVVSMGAERLKEDTPALLLQCLKAVTQKRAVDLPQRGGGRGLEGRSCRGRLGFKVLLVRTVGYFLPCTLMCEY